MSESFVESAMHLADPEKKVPEGIGQYVPKKSKGKKQEKVKQEGGGMGANHTHVDCGLHLDRRNYRKHNDRNKALINKSLAQYGAGRSILADKDGEVVAGNGVFEQARKLNIPIRVIETDGTELIAVKRTDLGTDDPRRKQLALADNATSDASEWEYDVLAEDWDDDTLQEWGIEMPEMEEDVTPAGGETDPDDIPEIDEQEEPKSARGHCYQLGDHRLMCGDSTSAEDVNTLMAGVMGNLWLSDPPYNVAYVGKTADAMTIQNDSMNDSQFRQFLKDAFSNVFSVLMPGASFYIFHADSEGYNFRGAIFDCGEKVRQCLIWVKNSLVMGRQDYQWKHEPILYGWKDGGAHQWNSDRAQTTCLEFNRPVRNDVHPTMKPIDILCYLVKNSSSKGEIVVDTFGGSGSTLIACEQTNRVCRTMELDPKYCDVIRKRWAEFRFGEGCDWQKLTPPVKAEEA